MTTKGKTVPLWEVALYNPETGEIEAVYAGTLSPPELEYLRAAIMHEAQASDDLAAKAAATSPGTLAAVLAIVSRYVDVTSTDLALPEEMMWQAP